MYGGGKEPRELPASPILLLGDVLGLNERASAKEVRLTEALSSSAPERPYAVPFGKDAKSTSQLNNRVDLDQPLRDTLHK
jgi:hypothetical protein